MPATFVLDIHTQHVGHNFTWKTLVSWFGYHLRSKTCQLKVSMRPLQLKSFTIFHILVCCIESETGRLLDGEAFISCVFVSTWQYVSREQMPLYLLDSVVIVKRAHAGPVYCVVVAS